MPSRRGRRRGGPSHNSPKRARIIREPISLDDNLMHYIFNSWTTQHPSDTHLDFFKLSSFMSKVPYVSKKFCAISRSILATSSSPPTARLTSSSSKYAYVTLLMANEAYLPGVLTLGYTLRSSPHDKICMCTPDISDRAKYFIAKFFKIVVIDYIKDSRIGPTKWKKFQHHYNPWLKFCFTKFRLFELTQYEKVLFLDADTISLNTTELDTLFNLPAPAGTLTSDTFISHARMIRTKDLEVSLRKFYGIAGAVLLLRPSLSSLFELGQVASNYFGNYNDNAGADEAVLSRYFKSKWTNISKRFNSVPWKGYENQVLWHYVTAAPWNFEQYWDDYEVFYDFNREMIQQDAELNEVLEPVLKHSKK
ncbi:hypothetical protein P9112_010354 [Eukaryota sp. TZLM1-RC]